PDVAETHQLAADRGPLRSGEFAANAVSGKAVMTPATDFFGVGTGQHLDDVVQAHAETAGLADAENAGEKFLCDERAVETFARFEAVVARAALRNGIRF